MSWCHQHVWIVVEREFKPSFLERVAAFSASVKYDNLPRSAATSHVIIKSRCNKCGSEKVEVLEV